MNGVKNGRTSRSPDDEDGGDDDDDEDDDDGGAEEDERASARYGLKVLHRDATLELLLELLPELLPELLALDVSPDSEGMIAKQRATTLLRQFAVC